MSDEYLWDGAGKPNEDAARVERALSRLRAPLPPPPALSGSPEGLRYAGVRFFAPALAMAAAIVLMVASTYRDGFLSGASWEVSRVDGRPRIGSATLLGTGRPA